MIVENRGSFPPLHRRVKKSSFGRGGLWISPVLLHGFCPVPHHFSTAKEKPLQRLGRCRGEVRKRHAY